MERIHRDRLEVTRDSAEDVEEMIWERFTDRFQGVPDKNTENPDFEQFFTNHIRKLLLVRGRNRYMTKSILGASRLQYLKRIFPDVRILLYIRHPIDHVASMMKQDRLWQEISRTDPRQIKLTQITGHHGFGPDYVPLNVGNAAAVEEICRCRDAGHAARARALQWASVYGSLMELLKNDAALASAVCVVRYEDLCANASETMDRILGHTGLCPNAFAATRDSYLAKLSLPDYYCPKFSPQEMADITMVTKDVAGKFGYDIQNIPGSLV